MARRYRRGKYYSKRDDLEDLVRLVIFILVIGIIGLGGWFATHKEQIKTYGILALVILIIGGISYFIFRKKRKATAWTLDDDRTLSMLKGMSPAEFEQEMATMFERLGYKTEVVGGANDGGIDVIARRNEKKYYIQCKKFITQEVTPHDVRDFLGAITNINDPAEKGFFITTNKFTLMAEKAAEGNPRIELIDGLQLVEYYKSSHEETGPPLKSS